MSRDNHWPEIAIITAVSVMLGWSLALSQERVVINTGHADKPYEKGQYDSAPVTPPGLINKVGAVIDRAHHTDPAACFDLDIFQSPNQGGSWQHVAGSHGICGRTTPLVKNGQPVTSSAIHVTDSTGGNNFGQRQWKTTLTVTSGQPRTAVAIQMGDIR